MSTQLPPDHSEKKKKSVEFANAILELADEQLGKKKTAFAVKVLEHAQSVRRDDDPGHRSQQGTEDLLELVQQLDKTHKKTSKTRRASDILKPFVEGVTRYSAVVDTMVQSNPLVSALVWGGVKFVLQLALEFSQHYESLTGILENLGGHLRYLGDLSAIFDWSDELCNILVKSYKNVLQLLEAAADAYSQSGFKAVLKGTILPFDRKYKHLVQRLEKNKESVRDSVSAAQSYMLRKQTEGKERSDINNWLAAPVTDSTFGHCIDQMHPGTCQWLFDESVYDNWKQATSGSPMGDRILWIHGPPGIGKTFLASSVIEKLQKEKREVIFYYFRDEKSGSPFIFGKGKALTMLRNLARQLVDIIRDKWEQRLPTSFWDIYEKSGGGTCLSDIESAVNVVVLLLAQIPRIHVVIDGLDECIDRYEAEPNGYLLPLKSQKRLPFILEKLVQSKYYGTVKWCFTGGPESDFLSLFSKLEASSLKIMHDHVETDVLDYVMVELDIDINIWKEIENDVVNYGRDGSGVIRITVAEEDDAFAPTLGLIYSYLSANFLYARLTIGLLKGSGVTNRMELLESIRRYKDGFSERYFRGLGALAAKPRREKELARRILTFVTTAERLLTKNELLDVLAVQLGSDAYSSDWRPRPEKFDELLAPLLELVRSDSYSNPVVRFSHRTAQAFMQQPPGNIENIPPECRGFLSDEATKHEEFGKFCLTYLTRESFGFKTAEEMEKALCNNMDDDCNSFLKYASIFWYHHLSHALPTEELFRHVARFMQSTNFLTCTWVQSQWAPYQLARYTEAGSGNSFNIANATMVFPPGPTTQIYYADPLPKWLSQFNEQGARLVQSYQLLIKEFGLVLLRKRGGIQHCHPCSLGTMGFLPQEDQVDWRALALQQPEETYLNPSNRQGRHFISANITDSGRVVVRTVQLGSNLTIFTMKEWQVSLSRQKPRALRFRREVVLPFPGHGMPLPEHIYAMLELYFGPTLSFDPDPHELLRTAFEDGIATWDGFTIPDNAIRERYSSEERDLIYRGRGYATNGDKSVVVYRWLVGPTQTANEPTPNGRTRRTNAESDSDSGSSEDELEPNSDTGNSSDFQDSGYASGSPASSTISEAEGRFCFTTIGVKAKDGNCEWYHFETIKTYLRQSLPVIHPTKPFALLAIDSTKTVVISLNTGEKKELHYSNEKHAMSRIYRFSSSGDKLYELVTTREFVQGQRWTIFVNTLHFDVNELNDIRTVAITKSAGSSVSWISPYANPFDHPDHNRLPFRVTWNEKYVFLVFGACEVYLVRVSLEPQQPEIETADGGVNNNSPRPSDDNETEELRPSPIRTDFLKVETTKRPVFLPASTIERPFTYIPHPPKSSSTVPHRLSSAEKEYAIFAIAGNHELPPVVIRKDINTDLGGWVSCGCDASEANSKVVGKDSEAEEEENDMKGKYSCDAMTFHVAIRSGLAWNQRFIVVCG